MSLGYVVIKTSDAEEYTLPFDTFVIFPSLPVNNDVLSNPQVIAENNRRFKVEFKKSIYIPQYNAVFQTDNLPDDGIHQVSYVDGVLTIDGSAFHPHFANSNTIIDEPLFIQSRLVAYLADADTGKVHGYFVLSPEATSSVPSTPYIIFDSLSVKVQNLKDIGKLTINLNENPTNWQVSFVSPTYYPPGTELSVFGITFIVTTVSKQNVNVYHYNAYLKVAIIEASALGRIDNTGAYKRVYNTDPYNWERVNDLTAAIQNIVRNRTNNTLTTPFERSFDRFESSIQWTSDSVKNVIANLYVNSQTLVIPWYENDQLDWISVDDLYTKPVTELDPKFNINQVNILGKPHKVKIFVKNKYKKAVTMYECPNQIVSTNSKLNDVHLDNGFYIAAYDGVDAPTVRFTYNYNVSFNLITRMHIGGVSDLDDSSGMATPVTETDSDGNKVRRLKYWFEDVNFQFDDVAEDDLDDRFSSLVQSFLGALTFVANPIIAFDSSNDWLDSYFPYPISPWNYTVYLKPTNTGKWIPSSEPYPVYDINLLSTLPSKVWTGAYGSVVRISLLQKSDTSIQKEIFQQGFYVGGFNVGTVITPFSLLAVEQQTRMPIIAEDIVKQYLSDISQMPDVNYEVHMISGVQKQLYRYGITLEQVLGADSDIIPNKTLEVNAEDPSNISVTLKKPDGETENLTYQVFDINTTTKVIVCYETTTSKSTGKIIEIGLSTDELKIGHIKVRPPKCRTEMNIIIMFATAIYFMTFRVFASPPFIVLPYMYKVGEEFEQSITSDYDIITISGYNNLLTHVKHFVNKSISFEWEGTQTEFQEWVDKLLPYRVVKFKDEQYVITQTSITIDGDFVKVSCTADNRIKFYKKWNRIVTDLEPSICKFEVYPRIPNNHYPVSKIYAFSDRIEKVKKYLEEVFKYTYTHVSDFTLNVIT